MFGDQVLVFDGAVGTELYERGFYINRPFEELNLSAAADVLAVHRAYIEAGADVITTNTFSLARTQLRKFDVEAKQGEIIAAALEIAARAVKGTHVKVAFSLGPVGVPVEPLGPMGLDEVSEEFAHIAMLAEASKQPFDLYILETFSNINELKSAVEGIRRVDRVHPLIASVSVSGASTSVLEDFASVLGSRDDVTALGLNCSEGPSDVFTALKVLAPLTSKPLVVQPNAGIPRQVNGRYFYMTSPDYIAKYAKRFVEAGALGVGGCCGTGPAHIRAIKAAVNMANAGRREAKAARIEVTTPKAARTPWGKRTESRLGQRLRSGQKVISVEMMSPKGVALESFLANLAQIEKAGVEFVNVPDGARAATRMNSLHAASMVKNRTSSKLTVIPHFTARDRNLIALQGDLLGAWANGVSDVLLVTGDPPKLGNNKEATGVYDIDSIGLTHLMDCLNQGQSPSGELLGSHTGFGIGVAANPTAINLELEVQRWRYKCEMGADFAITQPIYEPEAFLRWLEKIGDSERPHLVGIWPFVSLRNAEFMANEVPGVTVPEWALEEMAKAGDDRQEAAKRGVAIARKVMGSLADVAQGFCISAPLGRVEVALECL